MSASDGDLKAAVSFCETAALWSGLVLLAGLVAEVVLAIRHPPHNSTIGAWGSAISTFFVALGVGGELWFSRTAVRFQSELQRRADVKLAGATERATKAEEEASGLRGHLSGRAVTRAQFEEIQTLTGKPRAVNVAVLPDSECHMFALQIEIALNQAEIGVTEYRLPPEFGSYLGLTVYDADAAHRVDGAPTDGELLASALERAGFSPVMSPGFALPRDVDMPRDAPVIFVGKKPPIPGTENAFFNDPDIQPKART